MSMKNLISARVAAILIAAVLSGVSFTLGFLVRGAVPTAKEGSVTPAKEESMIDKGSMTPAGDGSSGSALLEDRKAEEQEAAAANNDGSATPAKEGAAVIEEEAASPGGKGSATPAIEQVKGISSQAKKGSVTPPKKESVTPVTPYSVQVAALKDKKDAEALKKTLAKKGYDAQIVQSESKGVYKVRTGAFTGRKEAEAFAAKLKTKAGLSAAFVVSE